MSVSSNAHKLLFLLYALSSTLSLIYGRSRTVELTETEENLSMHLMLKHRFVVGRQIKASAV